MKIRNLVLAATALLATPMFASTYFGGVEDWTSLDYDYNDVVFSMSGNNLALHSDSGKWFAQPGLGTSGTPFWNNSSLDAANDNVGYCIYGGGTCHGGTALAAGSQYLAASATSKTGSANDVTFSATGDVHLSVAEHITQGQNQLGWYSLSDPSTIHWLSAGTTTGMVSFDPNGAFGLVSQNLVPYFNHETYSYYSESWMGSQDAVSHFAFFGTPSTVTPEPGLESLVGLGLLGLGVVARRRKKS